ncbi:MAG: sigma-70 family RNA polymerase sigma factor [Okeania sp. SIO1H6]|nr:sigma-70 family RNA polymerase sigma factor [Okeania sp. SIO1H6]
MDEDELLRNLTLEASQYPLGTKERRRIVNRILIILDRPGRLCRPRRDLSQDCYEDIFAIAKGILFLHIYRNIKSYNPSRGEFLAWANHLFKLKFEDAIKEYFYKGKKLSSKKNMEQTFEEINQAEEINQIPDQSSSSDNPFLSEQVRKCIEEDPTGEFKATYTSDNPQANFQYIALKRLDGYQWSELSQELGVSIPALSNFYRRYLQRFIPIFRDYLSN